MAEVNTAELEAKADAAFAAGYGGTPPDLLEDVKVVDAPVAEAAEPDAAAPPAPAPEKPQYVRLTKQEWDNTKAAAGKVSTLESQVAKLSAALPSAEKIAQQVLETVRSQTPAGLDVEISDEDFADMAADFPELAKTTRAAVERILKKANVKGTGPAKPPAETPPAPTVDVNAAVEKALLAREAVALEKAYPDWADIVGRPTDDGVSRAEGNPFRAWLATQAAEYQKEIGETRSPAVVQDAISRFKASQSSSAPPSSKPDKAAARRAVLADAVTPRADGNPPPLNPPQTADEAFNAGFKAVKKH